MPHATSKQRFAHRAGAFLLHLTHGSLLVAGFVTIAVLTTASIRVTAVNLDDLGLGLGAKPVVAAVTPPSKVETVPLLSAEMERARDWIARRYNVSTVALEPVLAAAEAAGRDADIDPLLIVAVMAIESRFNPFAESSFGAQGLMQVIPRFHKDKIGAAYDEDALFDPALNVQVGTEVLREGLRRYGSLQAALQYYGGAVGDPNAGYARKVLALKQRLVAATRQIAATQQISMAGA